MHRKLALLRSLLLSLFLLVLVSSCSDQASENQEASKSSGSGIDLQQIMERDTLNAITAYSSTTYFIYRGKRMGYEYELLKRLADHLDVQLNIKLANDLDGLFEMLNSGEGDLIAYNLTVTPGRKNRAAFTKPHNYVKQVLVQRKPEDWRYMRASQLNKHLLSDPVNLDGDTVHIRYNSAYYERLKNLEKEISGDIHIVQAEPEVETEELIKRVAEGKIDYTVADDNIAKINQTYYNNIDVSTELSFSQKIAWAVPKGAPKLLDTLNYWISSVKGTRDYNVLYSKY